MERPEAFATAIAYRRALTSVFEVSFSRLRRCARRGGVWTSLALFAAFLAVPSTAAPYTYTATYTVPVPPASSYAGSAGGDGWAIALTPTAVYNVLHHSVTLDVACHLQSNAMSCRNVCRGGSTPGAGCAPAGSACPGFGLCVTSPFVTITDGSGHNFSTPGHPGMYLDQATGKLYVYVTRGFDSTAGVACVDTASASFCGFTALSAPGEADLFPGYGYTSAPMLVGHQWYAFNYVHDTAAGGPTGTGTQNRMLCFDVDTAAACPGQPYAVAIGASTFPGFVPEPVTAAIGTELIVPVEFTNGNRGLACYDTVTGGNCAGSWPVTTLGLSYVGIDGAPFPLLDGIGAVQGVCLPTGREQCFTLAGAPTPTPPGLATAIGASTVWNGPAVTLGPRVYVPSGPVLSDQVVGCYDFSTGAACPNFPRSFLGLNLLYTVNPDPQRPTCLWVNSNGGSKQIQNFDAFSGGACGAGPIRVLASAIVPPNPVCIPVSYSSLQILSPPRQSYTSGSVTIEDSDGNPIPGIPDLQIDDTGTVDLTPFDLAGMLPQFLITLEGAGAPSEVTIELTWTGVADPACGATTTTTSSTTSTTSSTTHPTTTTTSTTTTTTSTTTSTTSSTTTTTVPTTTTSTTTSTTSTTHPTTTTTSTTATTTTTTTSTTSTTRTTTSTTSSTTSTTTTSSTTTSTTTTTSSTTSTTTSTTTTTSSTTSTTTTSSTTSTTSTAPSTTTTSTTSTTITLPPSTTTTTMPGNLPPDCSRAAASAASLWPPNHQFVDVSVIGVRDPDGDSVTITVTGITQDEPLTGGGQGNTCPDATGVGTATASLRAEREGTGDGRVYHIAFTGDDGRGGRCTGTVTVCVPHDQGQGRVCVDQGPLVDSTGPTCVGACSSGCAIEMALSQPLCTGENVPATLVQRLDPAQQDISQAVGTSGKKKAKRLMRKGIKALKQAVGIAAKAANKGTISADCAASVATEFGNAKAGADRWLHTR